MSLESVTCDSQDGLLPTSWIVAWRLVAGLIYSATQGTDGPPKAGKCFQSESTMPSLNLENNRKEVEDLQAIRKTRLFFLLIEG
jgi:hypothetical protein